MEHPTDAMDYMKEEEAEVAPSIWNWEEVKSFEEKYGLVRVKFDEGATGHVQRKPTTLSTNPSQTWNGEQLKKDLGERLRRG